MWGAVAAVGKDDCWVLVELHNADQGCFDDVEGKVLCRGRGAEIRVSAA